MSIERWPLELPDHRERQVRVLAGGRGAGPAAEGLTRLDEVSPDEAIDGRTSPGLRCPEDLDSALNRPGVLPPARMATVDTARTSYGCLLGPNGSGVPTSSECATITPRPRVPSPPASGLRDPCPSRRPYVRQRDR